jgi:hypothetical protein
MSFIALKSRAAVIAGCCTLAITLNAYTGLTHAQINFASGSLLPSPGVCNVQACFANDAAKQKYERDNNCKFANDNLCGSKPINKATQCCGKDAKTGSASIHDRQTTRLNPAFNWSDYQRQCPGRRQSESRPDQLWQQCVIGQRHAPDDDWPIREVVRNPQTPNARPFCVDGCSTPPAAVTAAYRLEIFLVRDKDNPTGHPSSSFYGACRSHDLCYQTCSSSSQIDCDTRLRDDSLVACNMVPPEHETAVRTFGISRNVNTRAKCITAANRMFSILSDLGMGEAAFNLRRQQMCQCC